MAEDPGQRQRRTYYLYSDAQLVRTPHNAEGRYGPSAVGVVLLDHEGKTVHETASFLGDQTNNRSELLGINFGLLVALGIVPSPSRAIMVVNTDSQIAYRGAAKGDLIEPRLKAVGAAIKELEKGFELVDYQFVPRDTKPIRRAETLARKALQQKLGRKLTRRGSKGRRHRAQAVALPQPYAGDFFPKPA